MPSRCSVPLSTTVLGALLLSTNTLVASAANIPSYLRPREDSEVCGVAESSSCDASGLPKNFCCPDETSCLVGAANTTIICCPNGKECNELFPIVCDLEMQDIDAHPDTVVMTILLGGTLPKCGAGCCTWGYHCDDNQKCIRDDDQDVFPEGASLPTSSLTATSTSVPPTSTASTTSSTASSSSTAAPVEGEEEEGQKHDNKGLIAGVVVGTVALVAFLVVGIFMCVRNRRKSAAAAGAGHGDSHSSHHHHHYLHHGPERKRSSTSSFGNFISEPIMNPDTLRSDFGRAKETESSRVTSSGSGSNTLSSGATRTPGGGAAALGRQASINRYWGKEMADATPDGPHMEPGPKVGIARIGTAKGRTGAPQIGEIDMGLRATSSRGTTAAQQSSHGQSNSPNPFDNRTHRYASEDEDSPVSPKSSHSQAPTAVPPIRGMNGSFSRPYTPRNNTGGGGQGVSGRPFTPRNGAQQQQGGKLRPREPSGAEIDVFADPATLADSPGLGRYSVQTSFSDMMEKANLGDVARGAPYVPRSNHATPTRQPRR